MLTPRNPVNITADLIYRGGMHIDGLPSSEIFPSMKVQTIDAPKGVDLNGSYSVKFSRYAQTNVSSDTIKRSFGFTLKPGQWLPALQWLTPRLQLNQTIGCNFNTINPGYRNLILGPEDSSFSIISGTFGVNIFPSDMILLTNISDFSKTDSLKNFTTTSDLQLWFNSRNYLKGTWIFSTNKNRNENSGQLSFDRTWFPWLRTVPAINGKYLNDSSGVTITGGPQLSLNLNLQRFSVFKQIRNNHDIQLLWSRKNGVMASAPDLSYTFYLQIVILPNIELNNFETVNVTNNRVSDFLSKLSVQVNF